MTKPTLVDVTNVTAEEYEDSKVSTLDDLMEVPAGALFESMIASILDPNKGAGRPALLKIRNNGVIVSLLIGILDTKVISSGNETVN